MQRAEVIIPKILLGEVHSCRTSYYHFCIVGSGRKFFLILSKEARLFYGSKEKFFSCYSPLCLVSLGASKSSGILFTWSLVVHNDERSAFSAYLFWHTVLVKRSSHLWEFFVIQKKGGTCLPSFMGHSLSRKVCRLCICASCKINVINSASINVKTLHFVSWSWKLYLLGVCS